MKLCYLRPLIEEGIPYLEEDVADHTVHKHYQEPVESDEGEVNLILLKVWMESGQLLTHQVLKHTLINLQGQRWLRVNKPCRPKIYGDIILVTGKMDLLRRAKAHTIMLTTAIHYYVMLSHEQHPLSQGETGMSCMLNRGQTKNVSQLDQGPVAQNPLSFFLN